MRLISILFVLLLATAVSAHLEPSADSAPGLFERDTATDGWLGIGETLEEHGVSVNLGVTQIYQIAVAGPTTHRHSGRYTGSYDFESEFDLETIASIPGASLFVHVEGGWSDGLGASSVGSLMDVNGDAFGDEVIVLSQLFWQQVFLDGRLQFRIGKQDLTAGYECGNCVGGFDNNAYANDEASQFLNGALVNNAAVPFPEYGLGASVFFAPCDSFYVAAGIADAQSHGRTSGIETMFDGATQLFTVFELGVAPVIPTPWGNLPGGYRAGFWYDSTKKDTFSGGTKNDDVGFYFNFDQMLWKEIAADDDDAQGIGMFFRYGWSDEDVSEIHHFWSIGCQGQGLIPTRDNDVLGFGVARSLLSDRPGAGFTTNNETVFEIYYSIFIAPWLQITPSLQHVIHPGGSNSVDDATVLGVRAQLQL
jgi:porin